MKQNIRKFVAECEVCQRNKGKIVKSSGTLQPLPIPPYYLEGYLYGLYYRITQIGE
jgi:hypothetical protein